MNGEKFKRPNEETAGNNGSIIKLSDNRLRPGFMQMPVFYALFQFFPSTIGLRQERFSLG
jgi:hypothetical protein